MKSSKSFSSGLGPEQAKLNDSQRQYDSEEQVGDGRAVAHLVLAEALLIHVQRQRESGPRRTRAGSEEDIGLSKDLERAQDGEDQTE